MSGENPQHDEADDDTLSDDELDVVAGGFGAQGGSVSRVAGEA